jgi:H+-transporting ATPase
MTLSILIFKFYPVTALMIILLALLNDLPILAIAYDKTKIDEYPIRWNMREIIIISTILGILGVIASFGIFVIAKLLFKLPAGAIQTFVFLKLAVAGHLTIFLTRTEGRFWRKPYPAPILLWSAIGTKFAATLFAVYGLLVSPIGWTNALIIWGYALAWMVVNDFVKVAVFRWLRRERLSEEEE